jgi:hypothetical protein
MHSLAFSVSSFMQLNFINIYTYIHSGITTLSTPDESSATAEAPASAAPAPQAHEEEGVGVSVLRGLKPSPARG